jgi:hypothetical protein
MLLFGKPIEDLREEDLRAQIGLAAESRTLDFKRGLWANNDSGAKEWLKDITALANTAGGHIIVGADERRDDDTSILADLPGLDRAACASSIASLMNRARDGASPSMLMPNLRTLKLASGRDVLIVEVQRSWNAPHMVTIGGEHRFYIRHSGKNERMNVEELRRTILQGVEPEARARAWRAERCTLIGVDPVYTAMRGDGRLCLHLVPLGGVSSFSLQAVRANRDLMRPMGQTYANPRPNFDGVVAAEVNDGAPVSLVQLFRAGSLEAVLEGIVLVERRDPPQRLLKFNMICDRVCAHLNHYVALLRAIGAGPPFATMLSLTEIGNTRAVIRGEEHSEVYRSDTMLLEPILVETPTLTGHWHGVLRPAFDQMANAYGIERCPDYESKWNPANCV